MFLRDTPSNLLRAAILAYEQGRPHSRPLHRNRSHIPEVQHQEPIKTTILVEDINSNHSEMLEVDSPAREISNVESEAPQSINMKESKSEDQEDLIPRINSTSSAGQIWRWEGGDVNESTVVQKEHSVLYFAKVETTPESYLQETSSEGCSCPCATFSKYRVTAELRDGEGPIQTCFIQKIFTVLLLKASIVLAWLQLVECFDEFFTNNYGRRSYFHYISGVIYLILKLIIRMARNFRYRFPYMAMAFYFIEIIVASDFVACVVSSWFDSQFNVPQRILYCIVGTYIFFIIVGAFVSYDMKDTVMTGTAFAIALIIAVRQYVQMMTSLGMMFFKVPSVQEIVSALVVLGISELIIIIIMFELRSVLAGQRYSLSEKDWFFTAICIV